MITKEFLLKEGLTLSTRSPKGIEEYEQEAEKGYISVGLVNGSAVRLYAYSQNRTSGSARKVVLTDTQVTTTDFYLARTICGLK